MVPPWLYRKAKAAIRGDGTMDPKDLALYTRGLMPSPGAKIPAQPEGETFHWVKLPADGLAEGTIYVDGPRLDAEWQLGGFCARHGWAMAAVNDQGAITAAARGRPPAWALGIHGAELWGL
eukprot:9637434-Karenia_brevis.AAC.1